MEEATGGKCTSCSGEFPKLNEESKCEGCAGSGENPGEKAPAPETPATDSPTEETPAAEAPAPAEETPAAE